MKAMILAAGRGERMMPLTKNTPKPLLKVKNKTLIEYRLDAIKKTNITEVIINVSYLAEQIQDYLGSNYQGINITYSVEKERLNTAGGIINVLDYFENKEFIVTNADIFCDYPLQQLFLPKGKLANLVLVNNPEHNHQGDFSLTNGLVNNNKDYTFSGIAIYHPKLFSDFTTNTKKEPLLPILNKAIAKNLISGEYFSGSWLDIGTVQRLNSIQNI